MIDLHCHLHPGVDDGPQNAQQSRELAYALVKAGVTTAACTSHVRPDKGWMNTQRGDDDRQELLRTLLVGIPLEITGGAEHYMDPAVFGSLDDLAKLAVPYGKSRWLLIETPYLGEPPQLMELLGNIRRRGWRVLLAHVERFPYLSDKSEYAQRLVDAGIVLQVNLGSLAGAYNRAQQKNAERMLKEGFVGVLAGDCHRAVDVEDNIVKGKAAARKLISEAMLEKLTIINPQKILDDKPPEAVWP